MQFPPAPLGARRGGYRISAGIYKTWIFFEENAVERSFGEAVDSVSRQEGEWKGGGGVKARGDVM